eukprot:9408779-Alexandrium_andersonii.AAC.1
MSGARALTLPGATLPSAVRPISLLAVGPRPFLRPTAPPAKPSRSYGPTHRPLIGWTLAPTSFPGRGAALPWPAVGPGA